VKPNPLTPFPRREGGKCRDVACNVSTVAGERFGEGFSRSREKSETGKGFEYYSPSLPGKGLGVRSVLKSTVNYYKSLHLTPL